MIITVTLNPAIDQTVEVDGFVPGDTNRVVASRIDIGGKGINVARVLKELRYEPLAMGFAPGDLGRMVEDQLTDSGIGCDFIYIPGETRTNITILDRATHAHTVLSSPGAEISEADREHFLHRLRRRLRHDAWVIFAGSIPPPGNPEIYVRFIRAALDAGALVGVDADGPVLRAIIEARTLPSLVKLNDAELRRVWDSAVDDEPAVIAAAQRIQDAGVANVVVTRGARPSIALTTGGDFRIHVPPVRVESAVGAGDAFLAGLLLGLKRGEGWSRSLALGAASGSACCLSHGTQLCREPDVRRLRAGALVETLRPAREHSAVR